MVFHPLNKNDESEANPSWMLDVRCSMLDVHLLNRSMFDVHLFSPGFTLIEILVAITIFGILTAGIFSAFQGQMKIHGTQQKISAMQQNARAAMYHMAREIRMAGYDPTGRAGSGIRPSPGARDTITLSMDSGSVEIDWIEFTAYSTEQWIEAESAADQPGFKPSLVLIDKLASGEKYIMLLCERDFLLLIFRE